MLLFQGSFSIPFIDILFRTRGNELFPFSCSGNMTKRSVEFRRSTRNVSKMMTGMRNRVILNFHYLRSYLPVN